MLLKMCVKGGRLCPYDLPLAKRNEERTNNSCLPYPERLKCWTFLKQLQQLPQLLLIIIIIIIIIILMTIKITITITIIIIIIIIITIIRPVKASCVDYVEKMWKRATLSMWMWEIGSERIWDNMTMQQRKFIGILQEEWVRAYGKVVWTSPRRSSRKWRSQSFVGYRCSVWQYDRGKKTRHNFNWQVRVKGDNHRHCCTSWCKGKGNKKKGKRGKIPGFEERDREINCGASKW